MVPMWELRVEGRLLDDSASGAQTPATNTNGQVDKLIDTSDTPIPGDYGDLHSCTLSGRPELENRQI